MKNLQILDDAGYMKQQPLVDYVFLSMANGEPDATSHQIMTKLLQAGVGEASATSRIALVYSTTGAIFRTAYNRLKWCGFIEDPWSHGRKLGDPLRATDKGREYLATLPIPGDLA